MYKEPNKYHINETSIYKFILDTFNDNIADDIKFSIGYYLVDSVDQSGKPINGSFVRRFTQQGGRFDVKRTLDSETQLLKNKSFVPMNVTTLNPNYLAHNSIKEITYEPDLEFLVFTEDIATFSLIETVLQEIRARLIQYQTTIDVWYRNIEDKTGEPIKETLRAIVMAGEINYGSEIVRIAGRAYLPLSIPLTIEVTDHGEYANQERHYLSVDEVNDGEYVEVTPIAWHFGTGVDTEPSQMLNDHDVLVTNQKKSRFTMHVPKSVGFSYSMAIQIDFRNPILKKIFKDSRNPTKENTTETWKLKSEIYVYNEESGKFELDEELSIIDEKFILTSKTPVSELSQGEKYVYGITFEPEWQKEGND